MILDQIVAHRQQHILSLKQKISLEEMKQLAMSKPNQNDFPFEKSLNKKSMSFILEVKKASPSKGVIAEHFPYLDIAREYEKIGADAISVLTEPDFFQGDITYLKDIKQHVNIPVLRKDFIIDEYMIYESKVNNVDAILLICAILTLEQLKHYIALAKSLGLSVLVEAHDAQEIEMALLAQAKIIGINNRQLKDFTVDLQTTFTLRQKVPSDIIFVSESGIHTADDIKQLSQHQVDAVLIGEAMMTSSHKQSFFNSLRNQDED